MTAEMSAIESRLRELVEIESPTGDREGIARCFERVERWASPCFGRPGERREIDGVEHLYWPAKREGGVLILGHLDTVWPIGTLEDIPFRVRDGRATGPGVFDMKAGVVAAVGVLELLDTLDDVSLLLTGDEETGSTTSRALIEGAARRASAVLIFEPSLDGALKVARKGAGIYRLQAHGREAHAGLDPELGINALLELAHQMFEIAGAADRKAGTDVTPTVLRAGTTVNTVPDLAEVSVDVRAWTLDELQRVDSFLRSLEPAHPDARLSLAGGINRPPMERQRTQRLFDLVSGVARELGLPPLQSAAVGGGSDGNFTTALGIDTLDGLGPLGDGAHARHEWVRIESIADRSRLAAALIERLRGAAEAPNSPCAAGQRGDR